MQHEPVTYRNVLGNPEFRAVLLSQALSILGDQFARIALAVLVYGATHSAFAASATYAVSFLSYLIAGPVLSALSDRYPRRTIMVLSDVGRAGIVGLLALRGVPLVVLFGLLVLLGLLAPAFDSARSATLPDLLPGDAYPRGNALFNLVHQGAQVLGFVAGGALLTALEIHQVLLLDAVTFLVSAGWLLAFLHDRPPSADRRTGTNLLHDTAEGFRIVRAEPRLCRLLGFAVLSAAAAAAPESLAIPVADSLGGGTFDAGVLTASLPAGFLLASFAVLRLPPDRRERLLGPLAVLSTAPLLLTPVFGSVSATALLWAVSGVGSSLQLVASAAYVVAAPERVRARAYGLAATSLMAAQGLAQLLVGAVATQTGPRLSIALFGGAVLLLVPLVRRSPAGSPD